MKRASLFIVSAALLGASAFAGEPISDQKPAVAQTAKPVAAPSPTPAPVAKAVAPARTEKTSPALDRLFDSQTAPSSGRHPEVRFSGSLSLDTFMSVR